MSLTRAISVAAARVTSSRKSLAEAAGCHAKAMRVAVVIGHKELSLTVVARDNL
jgi:hypothetical protein